RSRGAPLPTLRPLRLRVLCARLRSGRGFGARLVRDRHLVASTLDLLGETVARPHDIVRSVARGVRAGDDAAATLGSARPRVGRAILPDLDLAAAVALALVHPTRVSARGFAARQDP